MPLFKTGHQPKTHMASEFRIEKEDREPYEQSVDEPNISPEERAIRACITKWARSQKPIDEAWIYVWNAGAK